MDFIDLIFSFIPLLMIILFILRFVAAMKKKRSKPLKTTPPTENQPPTAAKPIQRSHPPAAKTLNTLNNSKKSKPAVASVPQKTGARIRVNSLPELKRAVIWSEVLGKPKGLD